MTILEACLDVLGKAAGPMTAEQVITQINDRRLYAFKAQDPLAVLRATLRKHVRSAAQPKIREAGKRSYTLVR